MSDGVVGQAGFGPAGKDDRLVAHLLESLRMRRDDQLGAANEIGRIVARAEENGLTHEERFYAIRLLFAWKFLGARSRLPGVRLTINASVRRVGDGGIRGGKNQVATSQRRN